MLTKTHYDLSFPNLPSSFHQWKIGHISDYHNDDKEGNREKIFSYLKEEDLDMIAITGDLFDSRRRRKEKEAFYLINRFVQLAPVYFVPGNHESRLEHYKTLEGELRKRGVIVLRNEGKVIKNKEGEIEIFGIDDPHFVDKDDRKQEAILDQKLTALEKKTNFSILLSHRPDTFPLYVKNKMDLVLSGHAHGGQIRLPKYGGVFSPSQGFFPKYDAGLFTSENTKMVISRGIGSSIFPIRINNPPELVILRLQKG